MKDINIEKLRRFALGFGIILLIYSLAQVSIETPTTIKPLGIPLTINNPLFIGIGLLVGSIYGSIRYYIYAISLGFHPQVARNRILKGTLANESDAASSREDFEDLVKIDIEKHFPILPGKKGVTWSVHEKPNTIHRYEVKVNIPTLIKMFIWIHNVEYFLPVIVNIIAIILFILFNFIM